MFKLVSLVAVLSSFLVFSKISYAQLNETEKQDLKKAVKIQQLAYGEILFDYYREKEVDALTKILIAQKYGQLANHANSAELLSGVIYLNLGMLLKAQEIFNRLLTKEDLENEFLAKIEFYLAKLNYKQADYSQAKNKLLKIYSSLEPKLVDESLIMLSNIALYQNDLKSARDWLNQISSDSEFLTYSRYNIGILWLKEGNLEQALPFLSKVFFTFEPTDVQRSLQDKAKVALGFHYLKNKNLDAARNQFLSVRLKSSYTNKALLGVGWSYVEKDNYQKALSHWLELAKKDIRDIAVQEALLAIPYAYQKLGAMELSLQSYLDASASYAKQIKLISKIEREIKKGKLIKKLLRRIKKKSKGESFHSAIEDMELFGEDYDYYLYELLAQNAFNEDYRSFQKVGQLEFILGHWEEQLPMFSEMLTANQISFDSKVPKIDAYIQKGEFEQYKAIQKDIEKDLEQISQSKNLHLLASPEQKELYKRISRLETNITSLPSDMVSEEQIDKVRRAKGILQWQLETDKAAKVWELTKGKKLVDQQIDIMEKQINSLASARENALTRFTGYQDKIENASNRLKELKSHISDELDIQSKELERQILEVLNKRKNTLDHFLLQSDLAIARLHQNAMKIPEVD